MAIVAVGIPSDGALKKYKNDKFAAATAMVVIQEVLVLVVIHMTIRLGAM